MAGADVTMHALGAAPARHRPHHKPWSTASPRWMDEHEYKSVDQMKGSLSQRNVAEPAAFERANYMKTLQSYKNLA